MTDNTVICNSFATMVSRSACTDAHPHSPCAARLWKLIDSPWFFPALLTLAVAGLFFDSIGQDRVFAYRDALHFYPPLYRLVREEWLAGRVPLWNPLLNCGQPLAGMGTSGAFYVPQLVITMLLPDGVSLNVYCILHLAWAATGAYALSRYQGRSRPAATVAGLGYGFCGSVLLQIYNPIYAAGAAWLAWGVYGGTRLLGGGGVSAFFLLAVSLAMTVYCGDPQSGYHTGLVLGVFWLLMPRRSWRGLGLLALAGVAGAMLAMVQVAVTAEFMRETTRGMDAVPISLWDVPRFLARPPEARQGMHWYDLFLGRPAIGADHYRTLYGFPLQGLRLGEFFWPGMSGSSFGRWPVKIGLATPDWWVASLYAGSLTALATAISVAFRIRGPLARSWRTVLLLAMVTSLGSCGLVGLGRWLGGACTGQGLTYHYHAGDEVGGLYWLLVTFAPGYAGFRYPVKWMTVAMLAAGQLAAGVLDRLDAADVRSWLPRLAWGFAIVQALILLTILVPHGLGQAAVWPANLLDAGQADGYWRMVTGGVHGGLAAACVGLIVGSAKAGSAGLSRVLLAVVLAVDLVIAGRPDILVIPWSDVTAGLAPYRHLPLDRPLSVSSAGGQIRVHRLAGSAFVQEFSHSVRDEVRQTAVCLTGNLPWLLGQGLVGDAATAISRDMEMLRTARMEADQPITPRQFLDLAGVEFFMITNLPADIAASGSLQRDWSDAQHAGIYAGPAPAGDVLPVFGVPFDDAHPDPPLVYVCRNDSVLPRARILRRFAVVPPLAPGDRRHRLELLERIAFPTADLPDLRTKTFIEADEATLAMPASTVALPPMPPPLRDHCNIVVDESQRIVVEAALAEPGLLYLADSFHPDWTATVITDTAAPKTVPILRANRVHRAVLLPAGRHRVEFRYRSVTFMRAAVITAAAWLVAMTVIGSSWCLALPITKHTGRWRATAAAGVDRLWQKPGQDR